MKKNNLVLMIVTISIFVVLLIGATYAYFASNANVGNGLDFSVTTDENNIAFTATSGTLSLHVAAENMLQSQIGQGDVIAAQQTGEENINITLSSNTEAPIACTYNMYFQWNNGEAYLTPTNANKNEFTLQLTLEDSDGTGSEGNNKFASETQLTRVITNSNKTLVVEGASIIGNSTDSGSQSWVPTVRFYNLTDNQSALAGATFGGKFTIEDVECDKVKTLSETIVAQVSDNEYISSQGQSKYKIVHEKVYQNYDVFSQVDYANLEISTRQSTNGGLDSIDLPDAIPFKFENGKWVSVQLNQTGDISVVFQAKIKEEGTYQFCNTIANVSPYTIIYLYIINSEGEKQKEYYYYGYDTQRCDELGYIEAGSTIKIDHYQPYDYYASTSFYLQKADESSAIDAGVRYEGSDPDNYVTFNGNEEWRIIGVFEGSTIGLEPGKQYTKIINSASIGHYPWNCNSWGFGLAMEYMCLENGENNWEESSLKKYLNGDYYNSLSDKNKIAKYDGHYSTWYLNGVGDSESNSATRSDWFKYERYTGKSGYKNSVQYGASASTQAAIGIMYPSDYGYSTYDDGSYWIDVETAPLSDFNASGAAYNSWLYDWVQFSFLISPSPDSQYNVYSMSSASGVDVRTCDTGTCGSSWGDGLNTFPTLYLETNLIAQGTGSKADPYIIIN